MEEIVAKKQVQEAIGKKKKKDYQTRALEIKMWWPKFQQKNHCQITFSWKPNVKYIKMMFY